MVNILGGSGFIGSRYIEMNRNKLKAINNRDEYEVYQLATDILYFISTVDNYNVWTDPFIDIETNLITLMKTLTSMKESNAVFNFISSWFVYGSVELPAKEDSYCDPKGFYSITKRTAEQLLISYCETYNIKYRILRLSNVLGKQDKKVSKKKNALQYMLNLIKNNERVDLYDGGTAFRDYMYVDDIIRAINLIMEKGELNQIYNVGSGIPTTIKYCVEYAIKKCNSKSIVNSIETAEFHKKVQTTNMVLDVSKLKSLGFNQEYNIEKTLDILLT